MALTLVKVYNQLEFNVKGSHGVKEALYKVTFDASYPTAGEAFDPTADLTTNFTTVYGVIPMMYGADTPVTIGYLVAWDPFNSKLQVFSSAGDGDPFDEEGNTDDLSALTCYVLIKGI